MWPWCRPWCPCKLLAGDFGTALWLCFLLPLRCTCRVAMTRLELLCSVWWDFRQDTMHILVLTWADFEWRTVMTRRRRLETTKLLGWICVCFLAFAFLHLRFRRRRKLSQRLSLKDHDYELETRFPSSTNFAIKHSFVNCSSIISDQNHLHYSPGNATKEAAVCSWCPGWWFCWSQGQSPIDIVCWGGTYVDRGAPSPHLWRTTKQCPTPWVTKIGGTRI